MAIAEPIARESLAAAAPAAPSAPRRIHRPVLPKVLTDAATATAGARWASSYAAHAAAFHLVRVPAYGLRLVTLAPRGAWRAVRAGAVFALDLDGRPDYVTARRAAANDPARLVQLVEHRRDMLARRRMLLGLPLVVLLVGAVVGWLMTGPALHAAAVAALVALLGVAEARAARVPVTKHAADVVESPPLSFPVLREALAACGVPNLRADAVRFPEDVTRDGAASRAAVDLPVPAAAVIAKRSQLAAALRRPLSCLWLEPAPEVHEARLIVWALDRPVKPRPWPLLRSGEVNVFRPVVVGVDQLGRQVSVTLAGVHGVCGGVPGSGKSAWLRLVALAFALDPRASLHIIDGKGGGDFGALAPLCTTYVAGDEPEDLDTVAATLRGLQADMRRRYKILRAMPNVVKVTDELATADPRLRPVLLLVDESQVPFEDKARGAELAELTADLVRRGRAVGVHVWVGTQRPDSVSLPTPIRSNVQLRFALRLMDSDSTDMTLGTSSYKAGYRPTVFGRSDVGTGWLKGDSDDPQIVRAAFVSPEDAEAVVRRALAAREGVERPTLPADVEQAGSVVEHLAALWPTTVDRLWCDDMAGMLREAFPTTYGNLTAESLGRLLRDHGLPVRKVNQTRDGRRYNRAGMLRAELTTPDAVTL
ncbi:FtsK/SpoIIIE domain-containing protein [Xylanimonas protaetiae]|uniref:FtsK domain-containing protein n=1 Tax=Xylanimonas protaetiae TaxID=2509457 RepID=A0A4P6F573_9MICO|nr:FtsK/SpoIIIE domain-containing protein [Xylanimonas protaetiae]QAY70485.1 hypothetical protein ET471_10960 [Xylanimonas protaetiae]